MTLVGAALTAISPEDAVKIMAEYGPAVMALIQLLKTQHDDELRAQSMDSITKGLHYAEETGDTSQLETALRTHCNQTDGCRIL